MIKNLFKAALIALFIAQSTFAQRPVIGPTIFSTVNSGVVPITVKGALSQSSNLQEWRDATNVLLASVSASGVFSGAVTVQGFTPLGILYANSTGSVSSSPSFTFDPSTNNIAATTNLFSISGQTTINGILQLGNGLEFASNPTMGVSLPNGVRIRNNAGAFQVSNNGGAFTAIVSGSGANKQLTYWTGGSTLGALGAATNGQLPIGDTGNAPVLAAITGTANQVIVTNGAHSITLSTPQNTATTSNVTFNNVTSNGTLTAPTITTAGAMGISNTGGSAITVTGSADIALNPTGNVTINGKPVLPILSGTTGSISGALIGIGCDTGTASVTGATTSMVATASFNTYPGDGVFIKSAVTSANTVTVYVCSDVAFTPTASTYNVRVLQ